MASPASSSVGSGRSEPLAQLPHVIIFPFMAKGHTIPLTHLVHQLRRRQLAAVTFFTTPGNAEFVRAALAGADGVAVVELPFTVHAIPGVPPSAESVEALDSLSSFPAFIEAASLLRPRFEEALASVQPPASVVVADAFLYWAHAAAAALGVRTLAFFGTNIFAHVIREVCLRDNPAAVLSAGAGSPDAVFAVPEFPDMQLSLADIPVPFNDPTLTNPMFETDAKIGKAIGGSSGFIANTFDAMEGRYIEHWNRHVGPRAWPIGPLCLALDGPEPTACQGHGGAPAWMRWLDEKEAAGRAVLYVALGTVVAVRGAQLREVADGLEQSGLDFLWAVRPVDADLGMGFEQRVQGRGMVVREWVDQYAILRHCSVKGFISHCGWNSALESISAGVPLAAWPMSAEQSLNAKLVADELRVAVRVPAKDDMVRGEEIARVAKELMAGEKCAATARNMAALAGKAREAVAEGGSSWKALQELISGLGQAGTESVGKGSILKFVNN